MTFGVRNVLGIADVHAGRPARPGLLFSGQGWPAWLQAVYTYLLGCHLSHALDFTAAWLCYMYIMPLTLPHAATWSWRWVSIVVAYNLACELVCYGAWHYVTYVSAWAQGPFRRHKYNPENQYEPGWTQPVSMTTSSTGNLQREQVLTTLGWLQSSTFQCVMMWLWATGRVPHLSTFTTHLAWNIATVAMVTYWREAHFYLVHRLMHPWWDRAAGLAQGDVGAFLYRHVHSWHHKSYNPGPWSGLAMHPVEHFLYYTCTLLPLLACISPALALHPMHFLYAKFHADVAPIGGHDGFSDPGGNGAFHWLHHAHYECNYGVPLIDFDRLFGTYVEYDDYIRLGRRVDKVKQYYALQATGASAAEMRHMLGVEGQGATNQVGPHPAPTSKTTRTRSPAPPGLVAAARIKKRARGDMG